LGAGLDYGVGQPGSCPGCQDITGIIGNMLHFKLMFPHEKEFSQKLSAVWAFMLQNVCQPCAAWIKFKEYQF